MNELEQRRVHLESGYCARVEQHVNLWTVVSVS